jgi:hypothetical protein
MYIERYMVMSDKWKEFALLVENSLAKDIFYLFLIFQIRRSRFDTYCPGLTLFRLLFRIRIGSLFDPALEPDPDGI